MPTGHGAIGNSTGKDLSDNERALKCSMLADRMLRKRPVASILEVNCMEPVITVVRGSSSLWVRKAVTIRLPGKLSGGGRHHVSFIKSDSLILRRRVHWFSAP